MKKGVLLLVLLLLLPILRSTELCFLLVLLGAPSGFGLVHLSPEFLLCLFLLCPLLLHFVVFLTANFVFLSPLFLPVLLELISHFGLSLRFCVNQLLDSLILCPEELSLEHG